MSIFSNRKHKNENVDSDVGKYLMLFPMKVTVMVHETESLGQTRLRLAKGPRGWQEHSDTIPGCARQLSPLLEMPLFFPSHIFSSYSSLTATSAKTVLELTDSPLSSSFKLLFACGAAEHFKIFMSCCTPCYTMSSLYFSFLIPWNEKC